MLELWHGRAAFHSSTPVQANSQVCLHPPSDGYGKAEAEARIPMPDISKTKNKQSKP